MAEESFLDRFLLNLRGTCKYYTGYPKDVGPSLVIHYRSKRDFVQLLHEGYPIVVAFTTIKLPIKGRLQILTSPSTLLKFSLLYDQSTYGFREYIKRHEPPPKQ